jgi:hypothetical protein
LGYLHALARLCSIELHVQASVSKVLYKIRDRDNELAERERSGGAWLVFNLEQEETEFGVRGEATGGEGLAERIVI